MHPAGWASCEPQPDIGILGIILNLPSSLQAALLAPPARPSGGRGRPSTGGAARATAQATMTGGEGGAPWARGATRATPVTAARAAKATARLTSASSGWRRSAAMMRLRFIDRRVTSRARSVTRTGVKVQRRIGIAQALFWPTMILTGAALGTAAAH